MTVIEEMFGPGVKYKDLSPKQKSKLHWLYKKKKMEKMSDEERKEIHKRYLSRYRENNGEKYREYQREYRKNRIANDPEFAQRVKDHTNNYAKRKRDEAYGDNNGN